MQVTSSSFTVAEYCNQMKESKIVVNREYQRSAKVWPQQAKSYLIDTILLGFPMPKLSLYQKTDLKSRETIKEIVDGQQRSQAIFDFFKDELRLTGNSTFSGRKYSQLEHHEQAQFLDYQLSVDIFVGATEKDIRQVFRRINSYTVPLNSQEYRHATYQGDFKWFIVRLTEDYAQLLKDIGVFNEKQLSRMADAQMLSEIVMAITNGIESASKKKLNRFYETHDDSFEEKDIIRSRLDNAMSWIIEWKSIHNSDLMKSYNLYSLILAILHVQESVQALEGNFIVKRPIDLKDERVLVNLGKLAEALAEPERYPELEEFVRAGSSATTTLINRTTRFKHFLKALTNS